MPIRPRITLNCFWLLAPAILSGVCLFRSLPVYDQGGLAWVGIIPLFLILFTRSPRAGFGSAYACGIVFFVGVYGWILDVSGYTYYHHTILAIFLGLYFAFFGLSCGYVRARLGDVAACWAAPPLWVFLEFIRSNLSFLSLPWPLLGHSQYLHLPFIQIASITGVYGVSFMLVLFNASVSLLILRSVHAFSRHRNDQAGLNRYRGAVVSAASAAALVGLAFGFGVTAMKIPATGNPIKIAVAQGNIDRAKKWNPKFSSAVMETYASLTRKGAASGPDLIVWPEAATPRSVAVDRKLHRYVKELSREAGVPILLGSTHIRKIRGKAKKGAQFRNSVFLIDGNSSAETLRHDKIRLMPFGEYVPVQETIPWSYIRVPEQGNMTPGNTYTLFKIKDADFGVTICWENIFPDLARRFVRNGARFMVNATNEGWFGPTAPYQFLASSVFRSVENRIFFVRSANIGISCFIDPYGRIIDRVRDAQGKDINVRGTVTGQVIPMKGMTFYTRYGDVFAILCSFVSSAILLTAAVRGRGSRRP